MNKQEKSGGNLFQVRPLARFVGVSVRDLVVSALPMVLLTVLVILLAYWYVRPAPPNTITMTAGAPGSIYMLNAEKYRKILARNGIKLKILPSAGSLENLRRLTDPNSKVDIGFVQGGVANGTDISNLVSLGSIFHQPLLLFYRGDKPLSILSQFEGKRVAVGTEGSGTQTLAMTLLKANGIEPGGKTQLLPLAGSDASDALLSGQADAIFLMGDSATPPVLRKLLRAPGVRLFDVSQADAYSRKFPYLMKMTLPMGGIEFGKNIPPQDVQLVGPTVELVARKRLHPALSDLLIEAAREIHGRSTLFQKAGEFPAPLEHEFPVSSDAKRYYSSGKGFFYKWLPFWLASLVDRMVVVVVPVLVLLIPGVKLLPAIYNWRIRSRIYRWYGALIALERTILDNPTPEERTQLLRKLDEIEVQVNRMKVPLAFAEQFYVLRDHIQFVAQRYRATMNDGRL
ncbi:C4-dicarboxylate ABC transporter substrate-binding protein [Geomonas sp. Red276]